MIRIFYGDYQCEHYEKAIRDADRDIENHLEVGEVQRLCGSSHYLNRICQAVRCGVLRTDEVEILVGEKRIDIDVKGEFIQPWPDNLFESEFCMKFMPYPAQSPIGADDEG